MSRVRWTDALRLSVGSLTAYPVRAPRSVDSGRAALAMVLAPITALPLAALWWGLAALARLTGLALVCAVVAVGLSALVTRALHLDGLADTADGLTSGYDAQRMNEVMHRGDTGPAGAAAVALVILLDVAALAALWAYPAGALVSVTALAASRSTLGWLCGRSRPAAPGSSFGATFAGTVPAWAAATGLVALVVAVVHGAAASDASVLPPLAAIAGALVAALSVAARASGRLGGVNGDIFGAAVEISLAAGLVAGAFVAAVTL